MPRESAEGSLIRQLRQAMDNRRGAIHDTFAANDEWDEDVNAAGASSTSDGGDAWASTVVTGFEP